VLTYEAFPTRRPGCPLAAQWAVLQDRHIGCSDCTGSALHTRERQRLLSRARELGQCSRLETPNTLAGRWSDRIRRTSDSGKGPISVVPLASAITAGLRGPETLGSASSPFSRHASPAETFVVSSSPLASCPNPCSSFAPWGRCTSVGQRHDQSRLTTPHLARRLMAYRTAKCAQEGGSSGATGTLRPSVPARNAHGPLAS
jgi:hypothetical protein